ncbi:DGQHR domain-containing protein [Chelativorans sp. J32]|uniref:DGQHR domain-containing protein n=1 Tax=Chelativorans sp. J32 TaxID=935840 RepID=UPI00048432D9|nr:DGQHR domain-containing protein [Chelativorans sp. J32]
MVNEKKKIPALKVRQWSKGWNHVDYSDESHRRKPEPHFYLFSLSAVELRSLCGINRRQAAGVVPRATDLGIQRQHDPERSEEISRFVEFGYPWSTLSESKRKTAEFHDLRKPGWLPTAIVVNILGNGETRGGETLSEADEITVSEAGNICELRLPYQRWQKGWRPSGAAPIEVIDGQHRLWAFTENDDPEFEVPVVAFHNLDISWQAYLFWTINIKPKRINVSLAFDLYPLLRGEDWLDRAEGHAVYRETRSQELTEALWSNPRSPWYDRINMLGERQGRGVSQAAWIRSLMATFVRPWAGRGKRTGGLFGSRIADDEEVLGWSRAQQAAFLIAAWEQFRVAVTSTTGISWIDDLAGSKSSDGDHPAFYGSHSLIPTDQGVRGFLHVLNDVFIFLAARWNLRSWRFAEKASAGDEGAVNAALESLLKSEIHPRLEKFAQEVVSFDWRSSSAPSLTPEQRRAKLVFKGSGGYTELRTQVLEHLAKSETDIGEAATRILGEA